MKLSLVIAAFLIGNAHAWWFFDNEPTIVTADGKPIEDSCIAAGQEGSCEFFNCFERRFPCGREFYMQRFGNAYCNKFQRAHDSFTSDGQEFLGRSQQCVTTRLIEYYRRGRVECETLEDDAIDMIGPCYYDNGFCDIVGDNTPQFMEVFEFGDLLGNPSLWAELFGLARRCGGTAFSNFVQAASPFGRRR